MSCTFKELPSVETLIKLFKVVPVKNFSLESGLVWRQSKGCNKTGSVAGWIQIREDGRMYWCTGINNKKYSVSRLVYKIVHGEDPGIFEIDHIDKNSLNNNVNNLRLDLKGDIQRHNKKIQSNNKSGARGVSWEKSKNKWVVKLRCPDAPYHVGYFNCLVEAANAYNMRVKKYLPDHYESKFNPLIKLRCTCGNCAKILNKGRVFGI